MTFLKKNTFNLILFLPMLFVIIPSYFGVISAQVVINEVFPNPEGDEAGAEWVELYNLSNEPISLEGCILYLHESDNNQKVKFSDDDYIEKFKVVSWDESWLNNSGDETRLICSTFNDSVAYGSANGALVGSPKEGFTIGRGPDGSGNFYVLNSVTLGSINSQPPTSTPMPTISPTPIPTREPTATVTFTPTPTRIPTKTPTSAPTLSDSPEGEEQVLGLKEDEVEIEKDEEGISDSKENKTPIPLAARVFILAGLGLIGFPVTNYFRLKKRYNQKDGQE